MQQIDFNYNWICQSVPEIGLAHSVTLPHDAMISEKRSENSLGGKNIGWFEAKDYRYEKDFTLSQEYHGCDLLLELEGAYQESTVTLNGHDLGTHLYGYTGYTLDITPYIKQDNNHLEVLVRNSNQPNSRWYTGTGLYRPVWLWAGKHNYIAHDGIRIRTVSIHPAQVEISVRVCGEGQLSVEVLEDGRCVCAAQEELHQAREHHFLLTIPNAKLWDVDTPFLYRCRVRFGNDLVETHFGIRTLAWDSEKGICINGHRVILRGACIHHDNGVLGACAYPEAEARKVRILKEAGYNAIRSAHNPCSKALLYACDQLGMLVMDEYVDMWYIHKTAWDYARYMPQNWSQDLKAMVDKDFNHPSVILYSTGNEVAETGQKRGIALTKQMTDHLHQLDASRPVTCGINIFFNYLYSVGLGVYSDDKAKQQAKKARKPVGSEFYNVLAGMLGDTTMKVGATLHGCDVKTRDAFANMDIAGYNYGIFRYKGDLKRYPKRLILGSETFCRDAYRFWELAKQNPRIVGDFVWAGMDYIGEAGIGAWEYGEYAPYNDSENPGWLLAGSGRIDILGYPNGETAYTQVAFEVDTGIRMAVRPLFLSSPHSPSAWKMTDAIESWSFPCCQGKRATVEVYTKAHSAALFLNGQKITQKKRRNGCVILFTLPYQPGTLTAVGYDASGKELHRSSLVSAGETTCLTARSETSAICPNGLSFIPIVYTDDQGIWKPTERHRVRVNVSGGKLLGLGNACAFNPEGYRNADTGTYYGRALAVVQANGTSAVTVTISDDVRSCIVTIPQVEKEEQNP